MKKIWEGGAIQLGDNGVLKPGKLRWLRSVAWMAVLAALLIVSLGVIGRLWTALVPADDLPLRFAARSAGAVIVLCLYVLLVRLAERRPVNELALSRAPAELASGLTLGFLMMSAVMAVLVAGGLYQLTMNGSHSAWKAAGAAIEAGIFEEVVVRGVILRLLWRAFGAPIAFVSSAALFGLSHLGNAEASIFAALCIAVQAGLMLGAFYALTGRLWVSIGLHAAWNFAQGYVFGATVSGQSIGASFATSTALPGRPQWMTGGSFGPEASLPALIVGGAVGVIALWLAWKNGRFGPAKPARLATDAVPAAA